MIFMGERLVSGRVITGIFIPYLNRCKIFVHQQYDEELLEGPINQSSWKKAVALLLESQGWQTKAND